MINDMNSEVPYVFVIYDVGLDGFVYKTYTEYREVPVQRGGHEALFMRLVCMN